FCCWMGGLAEQLCGSRICGSSRGRIRWHACARHGSPPDLGGACAVISILRPALDRLEAEQLNTRANEFGHGDYLLTAGCCLSPASHPSEHCSCAGWICEGYGTVP